MRTLVRYSWHATWAIFLGTGLVIAAAILAPWSLHRVMASFIAFWCVACLGWCVLIWFSAACTQEGRSSAAPWASGVAVLLKLVFIITLFGDNIRRLVSPPVDGRPLRARAKTHRTGSTGGDDWSRGDDAGLEPEPELSQVDWLKLAGDEHASVAAFSRLSLELLAVGAPPELLSAVHRAAEEEVRHARLCFRVASLLSGRACTAEALPAAIAPFQAPDLSRLAHESLTDGWLNEGAAAKAVARLAEKARTPWLRVELQQIARDEQRHAELGAEVARWCAARREAGAVQAISFAP